jgi:hypothetical protein
MAKQTAQPPEDFAMRGLRYTREQFDDVLTQTERYVRKNPGQALVYAFAAGYLLNRLPVGRLIGGVLRLSMFALKPAVLAYGASKIYQAAQEE